jgi:2'-5' RNA ligase
MRLFVALDIPEDIRQRLADYVQRSQQLVPSVRFVRVDGLHITLKFLGETQKLAAICEALEKIEHPGFPVTIAGTGFFPNATHPRIFWAGIDAPQILPTLAQKIDVACAELGFATETRPFTPHLTLARSGSGNPHGSGLQGSRPLETLANKLTQEEAPHFGMMDATHYHLYESQLHPRGAIYKKIATFPLKSSQ